MSLLGLPESALDRMAAGAYFRRWESAFPFCRVDFRGLLESELEFEEEEEEHREGAEGRRFEEVVDEEEEEEERRRLGMMRTMVGDFEAQLC